MKNPKDDLQREMQTADILFGTGILGPYGSEMVKAAIMIITELLGWLTLSLEVLVRRSFGERYLGVLRIVLSLLTMQMFVWISPLVYGLSDPEQRVVINPVPFLIFTWVMVLMALWHRWRIRRRNRKGVPWYTFSFGMSHIETVGRLPVLRGIPLLRDDDRLYLWTEPLVFLLIGIVLVWVPVDILIGIYLIVASLALFIKNHIKYQQQRSVLLDEMDAQLIERNMAPALRGLHKRSTAGFSTARVPNWNLHGDTSTDGHRNNGAATPFVAVTPAREAERER